MEKKDNAIVSSCSFAAIKPIMMDLPYPPIQVKEKNEAFANLLSIDYGGAVSVMSAISIRVGNVDFIARYRDGRRKLWTPEYINISNNLQKIAASNIESEKEAINQYKMHIRMINDKNVIAVLERIIKDEEYHIMMLRALLESV